LERDAAYSNSKVGKITLCLSPEKIFKFGQDEKVCLLRIYRRRGKEESKLAVSRGEKMLWLLILREKSPARSPTCRKKGGDLVLPFNACLEREDRELGLL